MHVFCLCVCVCVCLNIRMYDMQYTCCLKTSVDGSMPAVQDPDNNLASSSSEFIAPWYVIYWTVS